MCSGEHWLEVLLHPGCPGSGQSAGVKLREVVFGRVLGLAFAILSGWAGKLI